MTSGFSPWFSHVKIPVQISPDFFSENRDAWSDSTAADGQGGTVAMGMEKVILWLFNSLLWKMEEYFYIYLVGGFKQLLISISYMGCHPSHWRTHIFQDGHIAPPTSNCKTKSALDVQYSHGKSHEISHGKLTIGTWPGSPGILSFRRVMPWSRLPVVWRPWSQRPCRSRSNVGRWEERVYIIL